MATGVVRVSHASLQDSILEHRLVDFNGNLVPDRPYRYLIAGSPSRHTDNFSRGGAEEQGPAALRVGERDAAAVGLAHQW
jgi:hypothetical protein